MTGAVYDSHHSEVARRERFAFGENWARFLAELTPQRISIAEGSLKSMLGMESLAGRRFFDVGCGSGLFSLAARRLGAEVVSFDYDPQSVACTQELRRRFFREEDRGWTILRGSALDPNFLAGLGVFDIVYSWGVLHHTGAMWKALDHVGGSVRAGGKLFIAIYNDQGTRSRRWLAVKKAYNRLPPPLRFTMVWPSFVVLYWRPLVKDLLAGKPGRTFRQYRGARGMSLWRDVIDWVGGYPFEVAKPEQIFDFYADRGFQLVKLTTCGGSLGCNEFVFCKPAAPSHPAR
jgi:2-polyprenyl-6-hydroxyphenyl methylase/3-demethylubiquinone-9 3-methyltransferase